MLYSECEQKFNPHTANSGPSSIHHQHHSQHLNILSPHLNNADYLASAAMSISPKYNTAFSVTNLLNPNALEESYKKDQQQQHLQVTEQATNFLHSYQNRTNLASNGSTASSSASSTSSSTSSSNQSTKNPSPSGGMYQNSPTSGSALSFTNQALGSLCSSGSNSSSSAANTTSSSSSSNASSNLSAAAAGLANPYFNYSNTSSYPTGYPQIPAQHHAAAAYNAYGYGSAVGMGQNLGESEAYVNSQFQYSNGGPQAWYSNPTDPRFTSKFCD